MTRKCDVIIVGSGIAGLYAALLLNPSLDVVLLTKNKIEESNSYLAQGGIAAAIGEDDSPDCHFQDTLKAGAGLCNTKALQVLVHETKNNIENLKELGVIFDNKQDKLSFTKEGGHSKARIIHIRDATGKGIMDTLIGEVKKRANITVIEQSFAMDLVLKNGDCTGIRVLENSEINYHFAKTVILACGGIGVVYGHTTNSSVATGDALAMAWRAGAAISDMEFIQFHPTVLHTADQQRVLISEAVRGEGAYLRNRYGQWFMERYDPRQELAPRDIVSRGIFLEMKRTKAKCVYLDVTHLDKEYIKKRFPTIREKCLAHNIEITTQLIPVSPAQHYCMGGIKTNLDAQTSIPGLYACGETACTGVHGANRLASNSLLEALVFARRAAVKINSSLGKINPSLPVIEKTTARWSDSSHNIAREKIKIQQTMRQYGGIIRRREDLLKCQAILGDIHKSLQKKKSLNKEYLECANMLVTAELIIQQSLSRKNSIGAHYLSEEGDFLL